MKQAAMAFGLALIVIGVAGYLMPGKATWTIPADGVANTDQVLFWRRV